jgi:hypothetical protein
MAVRTAVPKLTHSLHVRGLASRAERGAHASLTDGRVLPLWGLPDLLPTERIFPRHTAPEVKPLLPSHGH